MTEHRISVLVSAVGGAGHGEQILKALLMAPERERWHIVACDMDSHCPQLAWADSAAILPPAADPNYLDTLFQVCREFAVQAVFHGCEPELKLFSSHRDRFAEQGILLPINSEDVIETCMDKIKTSEFLEKNGFMPPKYWGVACRSDIETIDVYPVIVKPAVGGGGSASCFIAQAPDELSCLYEYLRLAFPTSKFIVQEYVGRPEDEYTVGVLHDLDGRFINSIAIRRLLTGRLNTSIRLANRTDRQDLGPILMVSSGISHGYVGRYPEVTGPCETIAVSLGVKGAINFQCRVDAKGVRIFEINPRFSGTTSIRAMMGYNEPDILLRRHLLGESVLPRFAYRSGLVMRTLSEIEFPNQFAPSHT